MDILPYLATAGIYIGICASIRLFFPWTRLTYILNRVGSWTNAKMLILTCAVPYLVTGVIYTHFFGPTLPDFSFPPYLANGVPVLLGAAFSAWYFGLYANEDEVLLE